METQRFDGTFADVFESSILAGVETSKFDSTFPDVFESSVLAKVETCRFDGTFADIFESSILAGVETPQHIIPPFINLNQGYIGLWEKHGTKCGDHVHKTRFAKIIQHLLQR